MQSAQKFWDGIAPKYAKNPIKDMDAYEYGLERTRSYLSKTDRVLELGCGTGSTALRLADSVAHITASDLSQNMVDIGRKKAQAQDVTNIHFSASDIADPSFEQGPYDAVLAFNLIHLLKETGQALDQIRGLVKPGGVFISKTPCRPSTGLPLKLRAMFLLLPLAQMMGKAPFVNLMDIGALERQITGAGFKIIETGNYPASPPPSRFIVAQRVA